MRKLVQKRTYEVALAKAGLGPVAGVDEAGRGECAGPITIAACILPEKIIASLSTLTDSKKLTEKQREQLFLAIQKHALSYSILPVDPADMYYLCNQSAN